MSDAARPPTRTDALVAEIERLVIAGECVFDGEMMSWTLETRRQIRMAVGHFRLMTAIDDVTDLLQTGGCRDRHHVR